MSTVIPLKGYIEYSNANDIYEQLVDTINYRDEDSLGNIILELSDVTHCDSAGIAVLIEAKKEGIKKDNAVKLVGANKQISDLATFLKVDALLFS